MAKRVSGSLFSEGVRLEENGRMLKGGYLKTGFEFQVAFI